MIVRLDAWTDFTCPFCFLATLTLDRIHQETQVELHWRAYQLRPSGAGPLEEMSAPPSRRSTCGLAKSRARSTVSPCAQGPSESKLATRMSPISSPSRITREINFISPP